LTELEREREGRKEREGERERMRGREGERERETESQKTIKCNTPQHTATHINTPAIATHL